MGSEREPARVLSTAASNLICLLGDSTMKFISFLAAASILAGCATSPSSEVPTVTSLTVKLLSSSVSAGKGTTITAEAALSNGTTQDVTTQAVWTSSNTAIALLACTQTPCPVTAVS